MDSPCQEHARVAIIKRAEIPNDDIEKPKFPVGDPVEIAKAFAALRKQSDANEANIAALLADYAALRGSSDNTQQRRQKMHVDSFMNHVARIQKRDNISRTEALRTAADEEPDALAQFRSQELPVDPIAQRIAKGRARQASI